MQPFAQQRGVSSDALSSLRQQLIVQLNKLIKHKDQLFEIKQITQADLAALINYQGSLAITQLVLAELQSFTKVDDTLAAFLSQDELLGKAMLYFFHEIIRKDERVAKTQAALQREGLAIQGQEVASQFKQLPTTEPEYSRLSIMVGSALSSTGNLEQAEYFFRKAIENSKNKAEKALAHFNLFQVELRRKDYQQALAELQVAIDIDQTRYALHDIGKGYYPIERLLGAGGMGCVFLCQNKNRLHKQARVVVKCFWETLKAKSQSGLSAFGQAVICGTLDYAPPEQQSFDRLCEPDAKNDVFGFGATMYRLCTQKRPRPFRERDLPKVLRDLLCDCVEDERENRPD